MYASYSKEPIVGDSCVFMRLPVLVSSLMCDTCIYAPTASLIFACCASTWSLQIQIHMSSNLYICMLLLNAYAILLCSCFMYMPSYMLWLYMHTSRWIHVVCPGFCFMYMPSTTVLLRKHAAHTYMLSMMIFCFKNILSTWIYRLPWLYVYPYINMLGLAPFIVPFSLILTVINRVVWLVFSTCFTHPTKDFLIHQ